MKNLKFKLTSILMVILTILLAVFVIGRWQCVVPSNGLKQWLNILSLFVLILSAMGWYSVNMSALDEIVGWEDDDLGEL